MALGAMMMMMMMMLMLMLLMITGRVSRLTQSSAQPSELKIVREGEKERKGKGKDEEEKEGKRHRTVCGRQSTHTATHHITHTMCWSVVGYVRRKRKRK